MTFSRPLRRGILQSLNLDFPFGDLVPKLEGDLKKQLQIFHMSLGGFAISDNVVNRVIAVIPEYLAPIRKLLGKDIALLQQFDALLACAFISPELLQADVENAPALGDNPAGWVSPLQRGESGRPYLFDFFGRVGRHRWPSDRWQRATKLNSFSGEERAGKVAVYLCAAQSYHVPKRRSEEDNDRVPAFWARSKPVGINTVFGSLVCLQRHIALIASTPLSVLECLQVIDERRAFQGAPIKYLLAKEVHAFSAPRAVQIYGETTGGVCHDKPL